MVVNLPNTGRRTRRRDQRGGFLPDRRGDLRGRYAGHRPGRRPLRRMTDYLTSYGTPGMYLIQSTPGKWNAYFLTTHNITQAAAVAIGANMKAVPKS